MEQKYDWHKIPDEAIKAAFASASLVRFSARPFNYIGYRSITFGDLGWWLPLTRVLPLLGITPQMLRPIFNPQQKVVKRRFPFNLRWFGLNKNRYRIRKVELPENIKTYEQLGSFPLTDNKPFQELARLFGKSVEVLREDGGGGGHYYLFTVHPSGEIRGDR
ncbi:MAG: hypothetical protein QMC93_02640 [Patescibacteria group bacterium]|nr:hypothetical protein [Patescibacteria group bacterium]